MDIINKYFDTLTEKQKQQFAMLDELYHDWNSKINVISRKDIDNLYEHHVLHSLGIAKALRKTPKYLISVAEVVSPAYHLLYYFPNASLSLSMAPQRKYACATRLAMLSD